MARLWSNFVGSTTSATTTTTSADNNSTTNPKSGSSSGFQSPTRNRPRLSSRDKGEQCKASALSSLPSAFASSVINNSSSNFNIATAFTSTTTNATTSSSSSLHHHIHHHASTPPRRRRINSRDIPRSYSGMYGNSEDLLPFEVHRNRSAIMMISPTHSIGLYVTTYCTILVMFHSISVALCPPRYAWTCTHALHWIVTEIYIHWLKGNLYDDQGEMAALTVWEQLEASEGTAHVTTLLKVVPTLLCWAACQFSQYDPWMCVINAVVWVIEMISKFPSMNGVRVFGINRTPGIDDDDEDEDDTPNDGR